MKNIPAAFGTEVKPATVNEPKKETTMPKTNETATAKNTAAKKENAMKNESAAPIKFAAHDLKGQEWITETKKMQDHAVRACIDVYGNEPAFEPKSLYKELTTKEGKKPGMLNQDPEQLKALGIVAHDMGWTSPYFLTEGNISEMGGKVKPGAFEFMMTFTIGNSTRRYYVANVDDVEFPDGKVPTAWTKVKRPSRSAFKPVTLNLPGGGTMTVHNKTELKQYQTIIAMMA